MTLSPERIERLVISVPAIVAVVGGLYWAISSANVATQTAINLTLLRTEMVVRLDRIDTRIEALPVLAEQVKEAQAALLGSKGDYASLEVRLRAIEANNLANHIDAVKALNKRP